MAARKQWIAAAVLIIAVAAIAGLFIGPPVSTIVFDDDPGRRLLDVTPGPLWSQSAP